MLPIILTPQYVSALVMGTGPATSRRLEQLKEAKVEKVKYFPEFISREHLEENLQNINLVYIADFDDEVSEKIANIVRSKNILLNIEDKFAFCDFHVPAMVRRGDLLLTASTGGKSPRVARRVKRILENQFDEGFTEKLEVISQKRLEWKFAGAGIPEVAKWTDEEINALKLFDGICDKCLS